MKKIFCVLVVMILLASCTVTSKQEAISKPANSSITALNGLYFSEKNESKNIDYNQYLRFYQDGNVVGTSSTGKPSEVITWLILGGKDLSSGKYMISNNELVFTLKSNQGEVSYKGKIIDNDLVLFTKSSINGHESTDTYKKYN